MTNAKSWKVSFLRQLVLTGDARLAAAALHIPYADVCRRRLRDREFAGLCEAALNMRVRWLELRRRFPDIGGEPAALASSAVALPPLCCAESPSPPSERED
jgi:hypothetical protein